MEISTAPSTIAHYI